MRKDVMIGDLPADETSIAFVERYWTDKWKEMGGPTQATKSITGKNEYKVIAPYLATVPAGGHILDGGCGMSDWPVELAKQGYRVTGLDLSRETVAKLNELFPELDFVTGDIRATEFADATFDAYLSWGVFEHFEEGLQPCVREAWRILKPGGLLFISVPADNLRHALRGALARLPHQHIDETARFYQWRLTRAELARELAIGGFDVETVKPIHKRQGVLRSLHHEFGLPYEWLLTKGLSVVLAPFVPGGLIAHMYLAVARKPASGS